MVTGLELRHVLSAHDENAWSDLLATMVEADPGPLSAELQLPANAGRWTVDRERKLGKERLDMVLRRDGEDVCLVEVKVLSSLGWKQLSRYEAALHVPVYALLFVDRLGLAGGHRPPWRPLTWESLLSAYAQSTDPWVRRTAEAWLERLASAFPEVSGETMYGELQEGEDFVVALRTRMAWVANRLNPPEPIMHDLVESGAGVSWVPRLRADAKRPGYQILVECEERRPVRDFPKYAGTRAPLGPMVRVYLLQNGVDTSRNFDWEYLYAMWPAMQAARDDWDTARPRPKAEHDRAGHRRIIDLGGPKHLGFGYGERQTRLSNQCMFGARFHLPPTVTLQGMVDVMDGMGDLMLELAAVA